MTEDGTFEKQIVEDWHIAITIRKEHQYAELWRISDGLPVRREGRVVGNIIDVSKTEEGYRISMNIHDKDIQKQLSQGLHLSIGTIEEDNEQEKAHS